MIDIRNVIDLKVSETYREPPVMRTFRALRA